MALCLKQQRIFPILHLQTHAHWYSYDCRKHIVIIHPVWSMRLFKALQEGRSSYVTWAGPSHSMELVLLSLSVCLCVTVLFVRPVALCTWMCILLLGCLSLGHKEMICTYLESLLWCYIAVGVCACLCVRVLGTRVSHSFQSVSQCSRFSFLVGVVLFSMIIRHFCFVGCFLLRQSV